MLATCYKMYEKVIRWVTDAKTVKIHFIFYYNYINRTKHVHRIIYLNVRELHKQCNYLKQIP
jgi:hypothetical protein